ncbi:MAG TPA: glycosyl transferase family 28, partial [Bacteroidetes bacterium]|nr:glycosyl transferase family 28 [Bacteroidota bacterium]
KRIVADKQITTVISDNRYGLYCKGVKSIIITHQLSPIFPKPFSWLKPLGELYIRRKIYRFSECWIPDCTIEPRLTGELSSKAVRISNAKFIGLLSRFSLVEPEPSTGGFDLVGLVSGPEPQRSIFEQEIISLAQRLNLRALIVRGLPQSGDAASTKRKITLVPHLPHKSLAQALTSATYVICRSGYSTIMDLISLKRSAILVPTPGQTEQEYLANRMSQLKLFSSCNQDSIKRISLDDLEQSCNTKVSQNQFSSCHFIAQ